MKYFVNVVEFAIAKLAYSFVFVLVVVVDNLFAVFVAGVVVAKGVVVVD